jgi:TPP-dependent 2-oxoacid decarboxylase
VFKNVNKDINFSITDNTIVIADVGDSLFGALDLTIHGQTDFLSRQQQQQQQAWQHSDRLPLLLTKGVFFGSDLI